MRRDPVGVEGELVVVGVVAVQLAVATPVQRDVELGVGVDVGEGASQDLGEEPGEQRVIAALVPGR